MISQPKQDEITTPQTALLAGRLQKAAIALGLVVALIGAGHLAAWLSGYMAQRGFSTVTMKANTALCLLMLGVALALLTAPQAGLARRWAGRGLAALAAITGLLSLSENFIGWNLGIDQLLAREPPGAMGVGAPNLMGTPASVSFLLSGLALLVFSRRDGRWLRAAQCLALAVCLVALLGVIGFLYGVQSLHAISRVTGIAWPTAVALLLLGLGLLLSRPAHGLMAQVTADDAGGANLRRWLPVLLLPVALGWLRLAGERAEVFDAAIGTAMMMMIFIVALAVLAYTGARPVSRSSAALQRQREWLRITLSSIGDAVIATDTAGKITFLNPVAEGLTGWKEQEALGRPIAEVFRIVNDQTRQPADDIFARALREDCAVALANHTAIKARDGREIPIEDSAAPIKGGDGRTTGVVLVFHDVTQKRRAEEALRESEERFRLLANTIPQLSWWANADGYITWYNDNWYRYTGTTPQQMEGWGWQSVHDPAALPWVMERWKASIATGEPFEMIFPLRGADGVFRRFLTRIQPLKDTAGHVMQWFGTNTDVEELERAQESLRTAVQELERSNKELEQFAYIASHDLQEPLRMVVGFGNLLSQRYAGAFDDKGREFMGYMIEGSRRMSALVRGLLDFSRVGRAGGKARPVPAGDALDTALAGLHMAVEEAAANVVRDPLPTVLAEPVQLGQLFQNLIGNALKFRRQGVKPEIHVGCRRDGATCTFWVKDNGIGIPADQHERAFVIFQRLHGQGKYPGTGIGLAICKKIVEHHGGRIWIESAVGEGSTFFFTMPPAKEARA